MEYTKATNARSVQHISEHDVTLENTRDPNNGDSSTTVRSENIVYRSRGGNEVEETFHNQEIIEQGPVEVTNIEVTETPGQSEREEDFSRLFTAMEVQAGNMLANFFTRKVMATSIKNDVTANLPIVYCTLCNLVSPTKNEIDLEEILEEEKKTEIPPITYSNIPPSSTDGSKTTPSGKGLSTLSLQEYLETQLEKHNAAIQKINNIMLAMSTTVISNVDSEIENILDDKFWQLEERLIQADKNNTKHVL